MSKTGFQYTTQRELRKDFWARHPHLPRKKVKSFDGNWTMYQTDARVAWVDWIDTLQKNGLISESLAQRATL